MKRILILAAVVAGFSITASTSEAGHRYHSDRVDRLRYDRDLGYADRYETASSRYRYDYGYDRRSYSPTGYCGVVPRYRGPSRGGYDYYRRSPSRSYDYRNYRRPGTGRSYYDYYGHH